MGLYNGFRDPLQVIWNDNLQEITEPIIIISSRALLTQIPDDQSGVQITNYFEVKNTPITASNQFSVDYQTGIVTFHSSKVDNTQISVHYFGRGVIRYPATRIYTKNNITNEYETLQDTIDNVNEAYSQASTLQQVENARVTAENARVTAENNRVTAESTRQSNETSRVNAESNRVTAENTRVSQESSRVTAESARQSNETSRQTAISNFTHKGTWNSSTSYQPRNIVTYNGTSYICIATSINNIPPNATYWQIIIGQRWLGTYSTSTTYQYGDVVVDGAGLAIYVSIANSNLNQALTSTSYWTKITDITTVYNNAVTATSNANNATTNANNAEALRVTAENSRVTAESNRVTAETARATAESARVSAETSRATAETSRANVESTRVSQESSRVSAESTRVSQESTRQSNETARQTQETSRATAESNRVTAESNRTNAESSRVTAEGNRVTAEGSRATAESARVTAENNRVNAESTRQSNESNRVSAESSRVSQETTRQTAINELISKGQWNSTTAYNPRNIITYNGSGYMCILANTNQLPTNTTYWQMVVQKSDGSVTSVLSTNSDITITNGTTTPDLSISTTLKSKWNAKADVYVGTVTPTDTTKYWIDTTNGTSKLKYYNGTIWVTADSATSDQAVKLQTPRTISLSTDATGSVNFDGTGNVTIPLTLSNVGTAGTYTKVTTDAKGRVTSGTTLSASDIPTLTLSKISDVGTVASKNFGTSAGNVPILDTNGKLDTSVIPPISLTDTFVVASETAMLALTAQTGDVAVRTDVNKTFILKGSSPSILSNWQELLSPLSPVTSVAGKTGAVTLTSSDVGLSNVTNESKTTMFSSPSFTGTPTAPTAIVSDNSTQIATTAFVKSQGYLTSNAVTSVAGKTGAVTLVSADVGLGNVTNESKTTMFASPSFTGTPTSTTPITTDNSTKIATTAFVQSNLTGGISTITTTNLTASKALMSDANGKVSASSVLATELGYLSGVTSSIQTQLNGKESSITSGTTTQYYRGDKTWQTLNASAVGLGNVTNESKSTMFSSPTFTGTTNAGSITSTGLIQANSLGFVDNGLFIPFPKGASYSTQTASITGAIKVTLPVSWTNTMMKFAIDIYEYTTGESFTVYVGGYNYSTTPQWYNVSAYIVGNNVNRDFNIRFGHDGTNCCIYIGEIASVWSCPQVVVRDFYAGYANNALSTFHQGWSITFATTLGTVSQTVSNAMVVASSAKTLSTARTISLGSDLSGSVSFDGSSNVTLNATITSATKTSLFNNTALTGTPTAPTPITSSSDTAIATTAFVKAQGYLTGITSSQVTTALGYTPVNKVGDTMTGNLNFDVSGGERQIKANSTGANWGMFVNSTGVGLYDWTNNRGVLSYSASSGVLSLTTTTTATTQALTDNSTSLATTAFVQGIKQQISDYTQAQFTLSGGGTTTWDITNGLKWSARFIAVPTDKTQASLGFVEIPFPTAGTVISGVGGASNVTTTANGVLIPSWCGLYAVHTIGGSNTAVTLKVIDYTLTSAGNVDSNWILIYAKNGDNNTAKLGTGLVLYSGDVATNGRITTYYGTTLTASAFSGNLSGFKNVDNSNEMTLANGFAGGVLYLNYRGATSAITDLRIYNGMQNGYANVDAGSYKVNSVTVIDSSKNFSGNTATLSVATGTAPLTVTSTTKVNNLNVDMLDNYHADTGTTASTIPVRDANGTIPGFVNGVYVPDTRNANDSPQDKNKGLYADFKANTTNGLSDGGTYNGVLTFRRYGSTTDMSGGQVNQLGFTDNGNMWVRTSTNATTWGSWNKVYHSGNTTLTPNRNRVIMSASGTSVTIGISGYSKTVGTLLVFLNSTIVQEGYEYSVSADSTTLNFTETLNKDSIIDMIYMKL